MQLIILVSPVSNQKQNWQSKASLKTISDKNFIEALGSVVRVNRLKGTDNLLYMIKTEKNIDEINELLSGITRFELWGFWKKEKEEMLLSKLR